jgi:ribonuclease-3
MLLEKKIGYKYKNSELVLQALTHPSFEHESTAAAGKGGDYQRLEFLGDAVLGMLLAESLYLSFPDKNEGDLSRYRSQIADQETLATIARNRGLGELILLGRGEELSEGRDKDSILADVLEALIGASYLDSGLDAARFIVSTLFEDSITSLANCCRFKDSKSELQELLSARQLQMPVYRMLDETGPPHDRRFRFEVAIGNGIIVEGEGRSKKSAQQAAAAKALETLTGNF